MEKQDIRIDQYIEASAVFAQPILKHLRQLVHAAAPQISETIKWGMPFFEYKGSVCNMSAFKSHCAFGFWKSALLPDPYKLLIKNSEAMGQLGRITSLNDLPDDAILIAYIKNAVGLNEAGIKKAAPGKKVKAEPTVPDYLEEALASNAAARERFTQFSTSHRREYIEWITEAKTEATRQKRINTAMEWLAEGKSRNWKYER